METRTYETLAQLLEQNRVFYHFAQLCKIPHPSFQEQRISNYLLGWARELGLEATQDDHWNVFIRKPATPGYEAAPAIMLQAHIDMVCEKAPGVEHNFDTDPISLQLDGDLLSTGGKTTLGADDGIGVAYAMAILEANDIPHPPLEVLLTTAEEEDLSGAQTVDATPFRARLLINIDNSVEHQLLAGSCGGTGVDLTFPAGLAPAPTGCKAFRVSVAGLPGGHSGEDISTGHGNANLLLARLLSAYRAVCPFWLAELSGGSFRLAIPRDAQAVLLAPPEHAAALQAATARLQGVFFQEYEPVAPQLAVALEETSFGGGQAVPPEGVQRLISALYLAPNGISEMNNAVPGVVESSDNLGVIKLEDGNFVLTFEIRAGFLSTQEYIFEKIRVLGALLGGEVRGYSDYPSWVFNPHSRLRELAETLYQREFNDKMEVLVVHAGLECGCFTPKMPGLDAISIGPDTWGLHSPQERLSISSSERIYHFIRCILAELRS